MISIKIVLLLLLIHWIADFILQSNWMAQGKSKTWKPLLAHIGVYTLCFVAFGFEFAIINGLLHLCIDYVTSRVSSKLWAKGNMHWFFVVIGFDQLLHMTSLILTAWWLL